MKKFSNHHLKMILEILQMALPGAGALILLTVLLGLPWPRAAVAAVTLLFQILVYVSEKRALRLQLWGAVLLLNAAAGYFVWRAEEVPDFWLPLLGLEAACAAAAAAGWVSRGRLWLKAPVLAGIAGGMVYLGIQDPGLERWEVGLLLVCILVFVAELAERGLPAEAKHSSRNALYLFPVFVIGVTLLCLLPVEDTPIRWEFFRKMGDAIGEKAASVIADIKFRLSGGDTAYSLSFTGFSGDGSLGGGLFSSDAPQISVKGIQTKGPLYLAGNIYSEYTGRGWKTREPEENGVGAYTYAYDELIAALKNGGLTSDDIEEITKHRTFRIKYEGIKTKSLFIAPVTKRLALEAGYKITGEQRDAPALRRVVGPGFVYDLKFVEVNYSDPRMEALLRGQALDGALPLGPEAARSQDADNSSFSGAEQEERRERIYEIYTGLPDTVPQSVRDLAEEITAQAGTDYDRLKAIQEYLQQFPYTVSPGKPPEDRDFTEYFLFEGKQGYCTYFATAMAVLARCEGIPVRYVEGFVTDETCRKKDETIVLGGGSAHAWVEAYIGRVGWVPFEATPGYRESAERAWAPDAAPGPSSMLQQEEPDLGAPEPGPEQEEKPSEKKAPDLGKHALRILLAVVRLLGILAAALCFTAGVVLLRKALRRRAYNACEPYERLRALMGRALLLGGLLSLPMEEGETLSGYAVRAGEALDVKEDTFARISALFQTIRFGGGTAGTEEVKRMERYVGGLEHKYLQGCGFLRGLWHRCVR